MLEPFTKCNIVNVEAVQHMAAMHVLNLCDYHVSANLNTKIKKSKKFELLQHRRAITLLCMFYKTRSILVYVSIPHIIVKSVKHKCDQNDIQSLHSDHITNNYRNYHITNATFVNITMRTFSKLYYT